ncbi:MAG: amidohydrolase family protein, partial [Candidatus Bathyarchaeota archaeon]|nr:amidohydrolase family protein [Candidatus Bathyarchaeota archaeon]
FNEIAVVTRAGQARILGLKNKGHLGIGGDGDISIYNIDPQEIDPSKQFRSIRRSFEKAAYTIKDGEIVVKNGEVVKSLEGRTFWVNPRVSESLMGSVKQIKQRFQDYYTVQFENYPISESHLAFSSPIQVEASV